MTVTHNGRPAPTADRTATNTYPQLYDTARGYHRASYDQGHRDGYLVAITLVAERADALDESWRPSTRRSPEQARADRLASLEPAGGTEEWLERLRQNTLRSLGFVATPDRLTPALVALGIAVSPIGDCEWPPVAVPGGGA